MKILTILAVAGLLSAGNAFAAGATCTVSLGEDYKVETKDGMTHKNGGIEISQAAISDKATELKINTTSNPGSAVAFSLTFREGNDGFSPYGKVMKLYIPEFDNLVDVVCNK